MPKISVIVPIYNVEKYVKRCLDSILQQTYKDFEVICVNDCTPDNSMRIVDEFVEKYPDKVKRVDNPQNMGLGAARDQGMKYARGEYLIFFDSDDYAKTDYLETYLTEMEHSQADIVMGGYIRVEQDKEISVFMKKTTYTPWLYCAVWMRMYRRSFLQEHKVDFRGIRLFEDAPFNHRCMLQGAKVSIMDYCGYYYVCNPTSLTRTQNGSTKYYGYVKNFRELYEEYKHTEMFQKNKELLEYIYLSSMLSCMLVQCRRAGSRAAFSMYQDYKKQMQEMFPEYKKNKLVGFAKLKEEQWIIKTATAIFILAEKMGLGKLLIWVISR